MIALRIRQKDVLAATSMVPVRISSFFCLGPSSCIHHSTLPARPLRGYQVAGRFPCARKLRICIAFSSRRISTHTTLYSMGEVCACFSRFTEVPVDQVLCAFTLSP